MIKLTLKSKTIDECCLLQNQDIGQMMLGIKKNLKTSQLEGISNHVIMPFSVLQYSTAGYMNSALA